MGKGRLDLIINTLYLEHLKATATPMAEETAAAQDTFESLLQEVRELDSPLHFKLDDALGTLLDLIAREYYRRGFEDVWALKEELRAKVS